MKNIILALWLMGSAAFAGDVTNFPASGGSWGNITGTLSSQTDLQSALNAKLSSVPAANIVHIEQNGSASCAMGDLGRPCDTYAHAYALIAANPTPPSYNNPYQIEYGIGTFTEPTVTIYPFVRIKGQGIDQTGTGANYKTLVTSANPFVLDSSFTTTNSATILLSGFTSGGGLQLNINVANGLSDNLIFQDMYFGSNVTIHGDGTTGMYFDHAIAYGGFITINGGNPSFYNKTTATKIILNNTGGNDVNAGFIDVISQLEFHQTNPNFINVTLNKVNTGGSSWANSSTAQTDANLVVESQTSTDFFGFGNQLSTYTSNFNTYWNVFTNSGKYTVGENINDLAIGLATRTVPIVYGTRASPVSISATGFVLNGSNISTSAVDQVVFAAGSTANALTTVTAATPISICTLPANKGNHLQIVGASTTAPILLPWKTGKLEIKGDFILSNGSIINLVCDGTVWREVSRSQGGGVGADNSVDEGKTAEGFFAPQNLVVNSGGEAGSRFAGATVSAGTFATTTTAADVGRGAQSLTWDPTATGQTLTSTQVTVPAGLFSQKCVAEFDMKGADNLINWQVWDGSAIIASFNGGAAVTLATSATYSRQSMGFTCPSSGTVGFKFASTGNAAIMKIDSLTIRRQFETDALLTGYSSGAGTVAATDNILQAINKLNGNDSVVKTVALGGTGNSSVSANRIMVSASASSISTDSNLTWDLTNDRMGLGGAFLSGTKLNMTLGSDTGIYETAGPASTANFLTTQNDGGFHTFDVYFDGSMCGGANAGCDSLVGTGSGGLYYNLSTNGGITSNFSNLNAGTSAYATQLAATSVGSIGMYMLGTNFDKSLNSYPTDTTSKYLLKSSQDLALSTVSKTALHILNDSNAAINIGANIDDSGSAQLKVEANDTTLPALIAKGKSSQSSNTFEVNNSSNAKMFAIDSTGNALIGVIGKGLQIKTGTNAKIGQAVLVGGTVTINNTSVTANSRIFFSVSTAGGVQGILSYTKVNATSFTINSTSAAETSTVDWYIVESIP